MAKEFTHLDERDNPRMVNVGEKPVTERLARARSIVQLPAEVWDALQQGEWQTKKGPVFQTAILAGIQAAKKTGELIPLCHPLGLDHCQVVIGLREPDEVVIDCTASLRGRTGVEMEALTGASVAALTIYDMCKAFSHDIVIKETTLMEKSGGKRDFKRD